ALQDIGIPVMHDDQHGTAVVVMAAMINSAKVAGKSMGEMTVAVSGAGAAGVAVSKILLGVNVDDPSYKPVKNLIVCDSKGIISRNRKDMHPYKY
ncbi:NAD-dependent malic enzyme, partial [Candidatus Woesearchaeota archaeon CG11_big_fil_rev_8_21_14_0_20_43_8]